MIIIDVRHAAVTTDLYDYKISVVVTEKPKLGSTFTSSAFSIAGTHAYDASGSIRYMRTFTSAIGVSLYSCGAFTWTLVCRRRVTNL